MESRHLFTFLIVVETGSFTKAALKMDYAQSSVTAQIQALETEIGKPLFDRIGRRIKLTDAGERLLPFAQEIQKMHLLASDALDSGSGIGGTLTIGAPESLAAFRLPPIIREYKKRFPNVKIVLRPGVCWELLSSARSGELDLAFLLQPETSDKDMTIETLILEEMALIAPPDHPLAASPRTLDAEALRSETILLTETGCSYRTLFEQHLNRRGVFPDPTLEFWSLEAIKQCVAAELGLAFLPWIAVRQECEDGRLVRLTWDDSDQRVATQVAYHAKKWRSPASEEFLRIVREHAARWQSAER